MTDISLLNDHAEILKNLQERINDMNNTLQEYPDMNERMHDLERIHSEPRLIKVEELINTLNNQMPITMDVSKEFRIRINKLEERLDHHEVSLQRKWQANSELSQRLSELENNLNGISEKLSNLINYPNVAWQKYNKSPYRCPVCHGTGQFELVSMQEMVKNNNCKIKKCNSCEGKGIVWG